MLRCGNCGENEDILDHCGSGQCDWFKCGSCRYVSWLETSLVEGDTLPSISPTVDSVGE